MITAVAVYVLLAATGFFIVRLTLRSLAVPAPVAVFWGIGVGTGVYSLLCLLILLACGGLFPLFLTSVSCVVGVATFLFFRRARLPGCIKTDNADLRLFIWLTGFAVLAISFVQINQPYGGWDAWSFWNFRASALFRSEPGSWVNIFHNNIQGSHPWLLPLIVAWGWGLVGRETALVPILLSGLFMWATLGLMIWGLREYMRKTPAILAGLYLVTIPFFMWHSASQYADILTGYYFLATIVCLGKITYKKEAVYSRLLGIFLALLAFSKDEGIVLASILLVLLLTHSEQKKILNHDFWTFFLLFSWGTIVCEVMMRSLILKAPYISSSYAAGINVGLVTDPGRWAIVLNCFWTKVIVNPIWGALWLLFVLVMFLRPQLKRDVLEAVILRSVAIFLAIFFLLYLMTTTDLRWRLAVTLDRLLYQIAPAMTFYIFYRFFRETTPVVQNIGSAKME